MKTSVAFLTQMPFGAKEYARFGVHELLALGCYIHIIDAADIVMRGVVHVRHPEIVPKDVEYIVASQTADLKAATAIFDAASLVICLVGSGAVYADNLEILRALSASRTPYVLLANNAIPFSSSRPGGIGQLFSKLRDPIRWETALLNRLPLGMLGLRQADWIVYGGRKSVLPRRLVGSETRPIWSHAQDYTTYQHLVSEQRHRADDNYAVYIDQGFGLHPGANARGFCQAIDADKWSRIATKFFDVIERTLETAVVIAAHPRADYSGKPNAFGGRRIVRGDTAGLIRDSRLAICAYSTAANLAVLFDKPLLVYSTPWLDKLKYAYRAPQALAGRLGMTVLDATAPDPAAIKAASTRDVAAYARYVEDFIRTDQDPGLSIGQIFHNLATICTPFQMGDLT